VTFARVGQEVAKVKKFYLVIDGEATQLGALEDPTVLATLTAEGIEVGKGPASGSGVCGNALDCGNMFKAVKSSLKWKESVAKGECPNSELLEEMSTLIKSKRTKDQAIFRQSEENVPGNRPPAVPGAQRPHPGHGKKWIQKNRNGRKGHNGYHATMLPRQSNVVQNRIG